MKLTNSEEIQMIRSMTGFGRSELTDEDKHIVVEIKAVNQRHLDLNMRMPRKLNCIESKIRNVLKEYITRGKIDMFITYDEYKESLVSISYNKEIAKQYISHFEQISKDFGIDNDITVGRLARFAEVISVRDEQNIDESLMWQNFEPVLRKAAEQFVEARAKEGEQLKIDLLKKCDTLMSNVLKIKERAPQIIEHYQSKLCEKVEKLLENGSIDEARIVAEVTLYADKIAIDEEIVRLITHINATKDELNTGGNIGKKLDFIAQEMNREANTILSKSTDVISSNIAIELKTDIEKIREQVQNIE